MHRQPYWGPASLWAKVAGPGGPVRDGLLRDGIDSDRSKLRIEKETGAFRFSLGAVGPVSRTPIFGGGYLTTSAKYRRSAKSISPTTVMTTWSHMVARCLSFTRAGSLTPQCGQTCCSFATSVRQRRHETSSALAARELLSCSGAPTIGASEIPCPSRINLFCAYHVSEVSAAFRLTYCRLKAPAQRVTRRAARATPAPA